MKICSECKQTKPLTDFYKSQWKCKPCGNLRTAKWRAANPGRVRELGRASNVKHRDKRLACAKLQYRKNVEKRKSDEKARQRRLKKAAYEAYGGNVCNCCGETEPAFLQIDHVNNDGKAHRESIGAKSLYQWLKVNGYPPGFQILCANCNFGKRINGGVCPHKTKKMEAEHGITISEV